MTKNQRFLSVFFLVLLSVWIGSYFSSGTALPSSPTSIPQPIYTCVPELYKYPDRYVLASSVDRGTTYYIVAVNQPDTRPEASMDSAPSLPQEKQYWESVVSLKNGQCKLLVGRNRPPSTLTRIMSKPQAQALELQRIKRYVQVYGREKLQQGLTQLSEQQSVLARRLSASSVDALAPETKWAYEQLGFTVPKNIPIAKP